MFDRDYARGYVAMAVKCAQFIEHRAAYKPLGNTVRSFYSVSDNARGDLGKLYNYTYELPTNNDPTHWYNPFTWRRMYQNRKIRKTREAIAKRISKSMPIGEEEAEMLKRYGGVKFMNVMPGNNATQKSTQDSIFNALNNEDLSYNLMKRPAVS